MDKAQALDLFWRSFGLPAIDENSMYDEQTMEKLNISLPYISYEVATANLGMPQQLTASLWYLSSSWADIEKKAKDIAASIGYGGTTIAIDNGYLHIMLPEDGEIYRRMSAEQDNVRRIVFNIAVQFLTAT